jgi:membrane protein required for colicin V production
LNWVDLIFGIVIALAMVRGYARGLLGTAATYVAPVVAFMVAADWSDPVRDRLAVMTTAPDIALDLLAPLVVFVVVVAIVRLLAALLGRVLGVGRSLPGRVLGAAASAFVISLVLGAGVVMVHELNPVNSRAARDGGTISPETETDPLVEILNDMDRRFDESILAPPLASIASAAMRKIAGKGADVPLIQQEEIEAAAKKAAGAAADAAGKLPPRSASEPDTRR